MLLNITQAQQVSREGLYLADGFWPHGVWNVQGLEEAQEREAADFIQVKEWAGVGNGNIYLPSAQARSSIIASCWRSANSTQSMPTASTALSRPISPRR